MIDIGPVRDDDDLRGILALQQENVAAGISAEEARSQGFVTVQHTLEILRAMHAQEPSIVARDDGRVVGYALVAMREARALVPLYDDLLARIDRLVPDQRFYLIGQICVAKTHRGRGVFDALYQGHRDRLGGRFDACITEIATRNTRSMRAHERVGFETLAVYRDHADEWAIVSLQLGGQSRS